MTKSEKQNYLNKKSIGYWSALGGVELKEIQYAMDIGHGIYDYAIIVIGAWTSKKTVHRLKINYNSIDNFIKINGCMLLFDECIRM